MKAMDDAARAALLGAIERQELGGRPLAPEAGDAAVADWHEVRDGLRRGLDVGSHTVNHAILTRCDLGRVSDELNESRRTLEKQLDRPITLFSYPNGDNDAAVRARVQEAGYRCAVTVESGLNAAGADPFQLRRIDLGAADDRYTVRAKLAGLHDALRLALGRRRAAGVRLTLASDEVRS
jgi:peptidoglycan/xylan/chitin deacetylase (PgdA/CDA1 family)